MSDARQPGDRPGGARQEVEEWGQRRAEVERLIDWLYSQRFAFDARDDVRALRRQLDRLDRRIAG